MVFCQWFSGQIELPLLPKSHHCCQKLPKAATAANAVTDASYGEVSPHKKILENPALPVVRVGSHSGYGFRLGTCQLNPSQAEVISNHWVTQGKESRENSAGPSGLAQGVSPVIGRSPDYKFPGTPRCLETQVMGQV